MHSGYYLDAGRLWQLSNGNVQASQGEDKALIWIWNLAAASDV